MVPDVLVPRRNVEGNTMKNRIQNYNCKDIDDLFYVINNNVDYADREFRKIRRKVNYHGLAIGVLMIVDYILMCWWYETKTRSRSGVKKEG